MKMLTRRLSIGAIGLILIGAGVLVGYRGEQEARDLLLARHRILQSQRLRTQAIETELAEPLLPKERRVELEAELARCRRGHSIPRHFADNARLFGYGIGGFLSIAGALCATYAVSLGDAPASSRQLAKAVFKVVTRVAIGGCVAVAMLAGSLGLFLYVDHARMAEAAPPGSIGTLQEFLDWKGDGVQGEGRYSKGGASFVVYLAPAGRCLASGPSGYLFDDIGRFVDWTPDIGDIPTLKFGFSLMSGAIVGYKPRQPEPGVGADSR